MIDENTVCFRFRFFFCIRETKKGEHAHSSALPPSKKLIFISEVSVSVNLTWSRALRVANKQTKKRMVAFEYVSLLPILHVEVVTRTQLGVWYEQVAHNDRKCVLPSIV